MVEMVRHSIGANARVIDVQKLTDRWTREADPAHEVQDEVRAAYGVLAAPLQDFANAIADLNKIEEAFKTLNAHVRSSDGIKTIGVLRKRYEVIIPLIVEMNEWLKKAD